MTPLQDLNRRILQLERSGDLTEQQHATYRALLACVEALHLFVDHGRPSFHKNPLVDMQRRCDTARAALAKLEP